MIPLTWYLVIGVIVLAVIFVSGRKSGQGDPRTIDAMFDAVNPDRDTLPHRISKLVAPVLIAALVVAVWPVALVLHVRRLISRKAHVVKEDPREFTVMRADLHEQLSIANIEELETLIDPLGGVPELPFGHLHAAWKNFLEGLGPKDTLWSFSAHWKANWRFKELRAGYVVVQAARMGPHFLTVWKIVEDAADIDAKRPSGFRA